MKPRLYPVPKMATYKNEYYDLPSEFVFLFEYKQCARAYKTAAYFAERYKKACGCECYLLPDCKGELEVSVSLFKADGLTGEAYEITVSSDGIFMRYGEPVGAFRAVTTLLQLITQTGGHIPLAEIHDAPDIERRGYMLDISRDRVPRLEEILKRIDILADLKYNELQMYIEQPAVEYSAYPKLAKDIEALTPAEVMKISEYARERFIELVPNHNSFGHSHLWLIRPELSDCQVVDNGYTFNPLDERTYEHFGKAYDSLLPMFCSDYFNVGCDEVNELDIEGSKTKEICDRDGTISNIYLKHMLRLHDLITARGKRMMIWADIILHHHEVIDSLPKDIIPLVWGYCYDSDLETGAKLLKESGFEFYVCPGTSAWACITGFIPNALKNIENAANSCFNNGGRGILVTDWGDIGSVAFPFVSFRQIAYGGAISWNIKNNTNTRLAAEYFDNTLFKVVNGSFSLLVDRLGEQNFMLASCSEYLLSFLWEADDTAVCQRIPRESVEKALAELDSIEKDAKTLRLGVEDGEKYCRQLLSTVKNLRVCIKLFLFRYDIADTGSIPDFERRIKEIEFDIREAKVLFRRLWNEENKLTGWYGFWWFADRQVNRYKRWFYKDERYSLIINDNKELGI